MKIAIVSDSHGHSQRLAKAIDLLKGRGAEAIVHCGDVGSTECIQLLSNAGIPAYVVSGNVDHTDCLEIAACEQEVTFSSEAVEVPIGDDKFLIATHGNDERLLATLIASGQFAYVCHGHTHRVRDEQVGAVRVINPGALHRSRDPGHPTAAILDTATDALEFVAIPR